MATPIRIKRSAVSGKKPQNTDLQVGELALNTYDGSLFTKRDTGGVGIATTVSNITPWIENYGSTSINYSSGDVGIGSDNPTSKLDINGSLNVSAGATFAGNITANGNIVGDDSTNISGISSVTATSLYGALTGNVQGNLTGTVLTGAQTNITSLGTLGSLDVTNKITANDFQSTVSTGTAPFVVASQTRVDNLNADLLDGRDTSNTGGNEVVMVTNASGGTSLGSGSFTAGNVTFGNIVGTALSVTGISTFNSGVGIADSIFHIGDPNTAIRFPTEEEVAIETAGSERLRIASDGKIGIGSESPAAKLDIFKPYNGLGVGNAAARIYGIDSNVAETGVRFVEKGSNLHTSSTAYLMRGISNGTTQFVFGANGKVGIGTTEPDTPLHIYANDAQQITVERTSSANSSIRFRNTVASMYAGLMTNATGFAIDSDDNLGVSPMFMVKQSNGNIGIGTDDPSQELTVYGANPIISVQEASASSQVDIGTGTVQGFVNIQKADGTRTVQISSDGDTYFNGGDVGIGTNDPSAIFDVTDGTTRISFNRTNNTPRIDFKANNVADLCQIKASESVGGGVLQVFTKTTGGTSTERVRILSDGKVKICHVNGENPTEPLHVVATAVNQDIARFTGANRDRGLVISTGVSGITNDAVIKYNADSQNSAGQHVFLTDGIERLRIDSSGNLKVTGIATFDQNVSIGGTLTYEDVTNIDSVGIVTAQTGIKVLAGGINAVGVVTGTSFESTVATGTAPFVVASTTKVTNLNADLLDGKSTANGAAANTVVIRNAAAGFSAADVNFQSIVGTGLSVTGIATAVSFSGSGASLTGLTGASSGTYGNSTNTPVITVDGNGRITTISTASISGGGGGGGGSIAGINTTGTSVFNTLDIGGDIDVDGHTELDNLRVSGISTFGNNVIVENGSLEIKSVSPTLTFNDTTGTPDYRIRKQSGHFMIMETTQTNDTEYRLSIRNGGLVDIPGDLNVSGVSTFTGNINANSSIGIGTTDPEALLHIFQNNATVGHDLRIEQKGSGDSVLGFSITGTRAYSMGIDNDDADKFKFATGSDLTTNTFVTITSDGLIGIGQPTPATTLEIKSNAHAQTTATIPTLRITNDDGSASLNDITGSVEFHTEDSSDPNHISGFMRNISETNAGVNYSLVFGTKDSNIAGDATEKLRIQSNGLVGIGTVSPASMLHIHSSIPRITMSDSGTGAHHRINADSSVGNFNFDIDYDSITSTPAFIVNIKGEEKLRIASDGNVGIGTNNPSQLLHLAADSAHKIILKRGGAAPSEVTFGNEGNYAVISNNTNGIELKTGSTPSMAMHIDQDGKVGIGTDDPQSALEVRNESGTNPLLSLNHSIHDVEGEVVRIGRTNATIRYHSIKAMHGGAVTNNYIAFHLHDGTSPFTNQAEILRLVGNGNVGIGTSGPSAKLEVRGDARITGILTVGESSLTLDGDNNIVNVGTALTLGHTQGIQFHTQNLHASGFEVNQINATGIITATTFKGALTGNATGLSGTPSITVQDITAEMVSIGGTLTYEDVTNINSVGIVTARQGIHVIGAGSSVGIGTDDPQTALHVKNGGGSGFTGSYNARTSAIIEGDNVSGTILSIMAKSSGYSGLFFGDESQEYSGQLQYVHSSNSFRILTSVSERVRINSTGVGIGTDDPASPLHIHGSGPGIRLSDSGNVGDNNPNPSPYAFAYFDANAANVILHADKGNDVADSRVAFAVDNDEKLRIDSGGHVLIGITESTANDSLLQSFKPTGNDSTITVGNVATSASGVSRLDFAPSNSVIGARIECHATEDFSEVAKRTADLVFVTRKDGTHSEKLRIKADGSVGIGTDLTTTPSSVLTVAPHNSTSGRNISLYTNGSVGNKAGLFFNSTPGTGNIAEIQAEYKGTNEGELVLSTSMQKRITIKKDGKVGIGSTIPAATLDIAGGLSIKDSTAQYKFEVSANSNEAEIKSRASSGAYRDTVFLTNNFVVKNTGTNSPQEKFRIDNSGNVSISAGGALGINGAAPQSPLDVIANASGYAVDIRGRSSDDTSEIHFCGNDSSPNYAVVGVTTTGGGQFNLSVAGSHRVGINSAGELYVGSNTGAGQGKLFLNDSSGATTTRAHIRNAVASGTAKVFLNLDDAKYASVGLENGSLVFRNSTSSSPTERLSINSTGDLTLQGGKIYGEDNASNSLHLQSTSANNNHSRIEIGTSEGSDNGGIHFYTAGASVATRRITIKGTSGNVGIGSTIPIAKLDVNGHTELDNLNVSGITTVQDLRVKGNYILLDHGGSMSGVTTIGSYYYDKLVINSVVNSSVYAGNDNWPNPAPHDMGWTGFEWRDGFFQGAVMSGELSRFDLTSAGIGSTHVNLTVQVATKSTDHRYHGQGSSLGYIIFEAGGSKSAIHSPFFTFTPGRKYRFDQSNNTNSGHPLRFFLEADKTTPYTTNVTTNGTPGSSGAYTEIEVTDQTPTVLHYQCNTGGHNYMGNAFQTNSNVVNTNYDATLRGNLNVTGLSTFYSDVQIGSAATFHDNGGQFHLKTGYFNVRSHLGEDMIIANNNDSVQLFFDNNQKLVTTNSGVIVTGILTATSFVKSGGTSSQYLMADGSVTTSGGGGGGVTVQDEGSALSTTGTTLNFVGSGVVASGTGATKTITISGGGGGGTGGKFVENATGIHTLGNVGVGTTNASGAILNISTGAGVTDTVALDIQGTEGSLFSVTNNLTSGSLFSINDVSGIPAFDYNANGKISMGAFADTVAIGKTSSGVKLGVKGSITEGVHIVANKLSAATDINVDNGNVHLFTTNETTTATPNVTSTVGLNTSMDTGDTLTVVIISKPNGAGYYAELTIDGVAQTEEWLGGSAPSSASSGGYDVNTYNVIKTGDAAYIVLANTVNFA